MTGADVLQRIVEIGRDGLADAERWAWVGDIAYRASGGDRSADGRTIAGPIRRLLRVGLVEKRVLPKMVYYRATARGLEVDAILARITVARGGTFAGRAASGIDVSESVALR